MTSTPENTPPAGKEIALAEQVKTLHSIHGEDTRAMVRELASILFFRYGETPSQTRVRALLNRGSMSTIADALKDFWDDVRRKMSVRIGRPDVPEALLDTLGELAAKAWQIACDQADAANAAFRMEMDATVARVRAESAEAIHTATQMAESAYAAQRSAEEAAVMARAERSAAEQRAAGVEAELATSNERSAQLATKLRGTEEQLLQERTVHEQTRNQLQELNLKFMEEREREREAADGLRRRALQDIEEARAEARQAREETKALRAEHAREKASIEARSDALAKELAQSRESVATSRAQLEAAHARETALTEERKRLSAQLGETSKTRDALQRDIGRLEGLLENHAQAVRRLDALRQLAVETIDEESGERKLVIHLQEGQTSGQLFAIP